MACEGHFESRSMPKRITNEDNNPRVILLLDLDCFYAQAVCVRLGWDAATTALALLQWNSVLAVTYPARQLYAIKRGDSWEAVRRKSQNRCHAVHVPVLTTKTETTKDEQSEPGKEAGEAGATTTLQQDYDRWFNLSPEQQTAARQAELGVRRYSTEGKACIECFRIASAVIFAKVHAFLQEQMPADTVVLERASIDEFFLDVTAGVDFLEEHATDTDEVLVTKEAVQNTVVIGKDASSNCSASSFPDPGQNEDQDMDAAETRRWQRGCWIAHQIRTAVHETLGFTMSAGIGPNKTIAKLAASYGKPAGQAICYPQQIEGLLQRTEIRSCRNLGGKLGASLQKLLPPEAPTTVGSIARYLSLPVLRQAFPPRDAPGIAEWIHQMARGVDSEAVQAKTEQAAVLVKSITAFKSLNFIVPTSSDNDDSSSNKRQPSAGEGHTLAQASRWIQLLAQEVVTRVERDAHRHHRYPRVCTIQYTPTATTTASSNNRRNSSKSVRVPFPAERLSTAQKVEQLVTAVPRAIAGKESDEVRLNGVGLCAIDFEARGRGSQSIDSFFTSSSTSGTASGGDARTAAAAATAAAPNNVHGTTITAQSPTQSNSSHKRPRVSSSSKKPAVVVDADLELAKKLQAQYDRENRVWEVLDKTKKKKKQKSGGDAGKSAAVKSHRIDTFFQKKT